MMKPRTLAIVFFLAMWAGAEDVLDAGTFCNDGKMHEYAKADGTKEIRYNLPAIPDTSCYLVATEVKPGINISPAGVSLFFFDQNFSFSLNVKENGVVKKKTLPMRFVIFEDEKDYNAIQAIVQTAYASRGSLSLIFTNPGVKTYDFSTYIQSKRKKESWCYTTTDASGNVIQLQCPVQSVQLFPN